jgi:hypothetical protein
MIIAIDFDNTIVKTSVKGYDVEIKRLKFLAKKVINSLHNEGHTIIINTLREDGKHTKMGNALRKAKTYLKKKGIKYHFINENDPYLISQWGESRKIACDVNIDDRNIIPLTSWPIIWLILRIKQTWIEIKGDFIEWLERNKIV